MECLDCGSVFSALDLDESVRCPSCNSQNVASAEGYASARFVAADDDDAEAWS